MTKGSLLLSVLLERCNWPDDSVTGNSGLSGGKEKGIPRETKITLETNLFSPLGPHRPGTPNREALAAERGAFVLWLDWNSAFEEMSLVILSESWW